MARTDLPSADALARLAIDAGVAAMRVYDSDFEVLSKEDKSPVTEADTAVEALIETGLNTLAPGIPMIGEEDCADGKFPDHGELFFLVDPIDGTREFVNRTGEFTINIALIARATPVLGVVYAPAIGRLFVAEALDHAWQAEIAPGGALPPSQGRKRLHIRKAPAEGLTAIASRSHRSAETNTWLENHGVTDIVSAGSSLKFCLVAAGEADLYPRFGRTMEWDTAAGHAVAQAAGALVLDAETGQPLRYGKTGRGYDNPHFVVYGDVSPDLG